MEKKKALVYVWTGIGAGKTTSALGVALREAGHKQKVVFIQFMKGRKNIGEWKARKKLAPYFEMRRFGRPGWVDLKKPSKKDKALAEKGLAFAEKCLKKKPPLLVLDEINLAMAIGLLSTAQVLAFLNKVPPQTTVYLTGRYAPKEIIDRADFATEFVTLKMPKKFKARQGIDY